MALTLVNIVKRRSGLILFVAGFVVASLIYRWSPYTSSKSARKRAVLFGDSITQQGYGIDGEEGWVAMLSDWWTRKVDVFNRGFSGYNSRWAANMYDDVVLSLKPDILFLFFGANDAAIESDNKYVPISQYKSNLDFMITAAKNTYPGMPIVVITPPPIDENKLREFNRGRGYGPVINRMNDRTRSYAIACCEVAHQHEVVCLNAWDFLGGDSEHRGEYLVDGLHLNGKGNRKLFEFIKLSIEQNLPAWLPDNLPMHKPTWSQIVDAETVHSRQ